MTFIPGEGPCALWIEASDVLTQPGCEGLDETIAGEIALACSDLLYRYSGQQYTGACGPVTVRPISRPEDIDTRGLGLMVGMGGWNASWGVCTSYGSAASGIASHYNCSNPPEVDLGAYPITAIDEVVIDGVTIPSNEYMIGPSYHTLVRMRTSASATPTERWGWPTCQLYDLPLTEPGTFGVTFHFGTPPPPSGIMAVKALSRAMALHQLGKPNELPTRVQSVQRQGIATVILDIMDYVAAGRTGIWQCDVFIKAVNPSGAVQPASVWSPDVGRPRRNPR